MINKQTILNQIEITENNSIQLRFAFNLVENGNVISSAWHRTIIEKGGNIDAAIEILNNNFSLLGNEQIAAEDVLKIKSVADLANTL